MLMFVQSGQESQDHQHPATRHACSTSTRTGMSGPYGSQTHLALTGTPAAATEVGPVRLSSMWQPWFICLIPAAAIQGPHASRPPPSERLIT
jgi:hypothetical protein